jgi:hypothetical protein
MYSAAIETKGGGWKPESTPAAGLGSRSGGAPVRGRAAAARASRVDARARAGARGWPSKGRRRGSPGRSRPGEQTDGGAASGCPVGVRRAPDGPRRAWRGSAAEPGRIGSGLRARPNPIG